VDRHEVLIYDGLDIGGLDETIEFLAPPSPGGVEDGKDGAVAGRGLGRSLVEQRRGRWRLLRVRQGGAEQ